MTRRKQLTERAELLPTSCAICRTPGNAREVCSARLNSRAMNPSTFSARRLPDGIRARFVRCNTCGLVRADPTLATEALSDLYGRSGFDYVGQLPCLRQKHASYLAALTVYGVRKGALLEIGCGNGFFLEEALKQGFQRVQGVEPSRNAVAVASAQVQASIVCSVMRPGLFEASCFDVVCMFQTLDHLPDPALVLDECLRVLKPGGLALCLNHDVDAWTARLLRCRSPIFDIEHTFLYSRSTLTRLFRGHGFIVRKVGIARDILTAHYLTWLFPFPAILKRPLLNWLRRSWLGHVSLTVPLGNVYLVAQKPA